MAAALINIGDLRTELREHLGMDSSDLPSANADLLVNRSYWALRDKVPFRKTELTNAPTIVIGTRNYAMPSSFDAIRYVTLEHPDTKVHKTLQRTTRFVYENKYTNTTSDRGEPEIYFREKDDMILWPTPDKVYVVEIGYWGIFTDLSDSNTDPEMPQEWHEIILFGAVWRGFLRLKDFNRARAVEAIQVNLINDTTPTEAKEEEDSRLAHVELPEELTQI